VFFFKVQILISLNYSRHFHSLLILQLWLRIGVLMICLNYTSSYDEVSIIDKASWICVHACGWWVDHNINFDICWLYIDYILLVCRPYTNHILTKLLTMYYINLLYCKMVHSLLVNLVGEFTLSIFKLFMLL
jgi:hypothetical protein